jgi:hypothetical protein
MASAIGTTSINTDRIRAAMEQSGAYVAQRMKKA